MHSQPVSVQHRQRDHTGTLHCVLDTLRSSRLGARFPSSPSVRTVHAIWVATAVGGSSILGLNSASLSCLYNTAFETTALILGLYALFGLMISTIEVGSLIIYNKKTNLNNFKSI